MSATSLPAPRDTGYVIRHFLPSPVVTSATASRHFLNQIRQTHSHSLSSPSPSSRPTPLHLLLPRSDYLPSLPSLRSRSVGLVCVVHLRKDVVVPHGVPHVAHGLVQKPLLLDDRHVRRPVLGLGEVLVHLELPRVGFSSRPRAERS